MLSTSTPQITVRAEAPSDHLALQRLAALDSFEALQAWADACVADIDAVYRVGGCVYGSLAGELIDADDEIHDDLSAPEDFSFKPRMKAQSDGINDDWARRYSELRLGTEFDLVPTVPESAPATSS